MVAVVAKDTEKLIRQLSLISYLMAERRPVTATEIRRDVEGYSDMTEDAFARRFYADRAELDSLGIHLSVDRPADGFSEQENYSLAPEAFFLPAVEFTDAELAALQTALSLLDGEFAYAEPLRLALQQLTWGRPSPLDSPAQRAIGLGITGSAGGAELSARLAKVDTAIYRRKRIEFEYFTMQTRRDRAAQGRPVRAAVRGRPVLPRRLVARARGDPRVPALAHPRQGGLRDEGRARLPAPRRTSTRASTPTASRGSSASRAGTAEIWVSDRIAWHVERNFGALRGADRRRRRRPDLPHAVREPAAVARVGDRLRAARARARAARAGRGAAPAAGSRRGAAPRRPARVDRPGPRRPRPCRSSASPARASASRPASARSASRASSRSRRS